MVCVCVHALFVLILRCLLNDDRPNDVLLPPSQSRLIISFSVGEPSVKLDMLDDRFMFELTLNIDGYCCISPFSPSVSSMGRHVSTIASKQLTNNSLLSAVPLYYTHARIRNTDRGEYRLCTYLRVWTGKSPQSTEATTL